MKKHLLLFSFLLTTFTFSQLFAQTPETASDAKDKKTVALPVSTLDQANAPQYTKAVLTFDEKEHRYGTIKGGEIVEHTFTFKNTGTEDLKIEGVKASCGCTTPEWPKEPIAPGESGAIKVTFNSKGKGGYQHKSVTVRYGAEKPAVVWLKGLVKGNIEEK